MSGLYNIYSNKKYIDKSENSLDLINSIFSGLDQKISRLNENLSSPETQKRINEFVGSLEEKVRETFPPVFSPSYSQPPRVNFGSSIPPNPVPVMSRAEPVIIPQVEPTPQPTNKQPSTTNYQPQEPPKKKKRHNPEITPEDRAAFERMKTPLDLPQRFVRPPKIPGY